VTPQGQPGTVPTPPSFPGGQPLLILDFTAGKPPELASPPPRSSLRERIAQWLDQPL
jgi:hypothetical protein